MSDLDTIFALSSGAGKSGVAVIRISGTDLDDFFTLTLNPKPLTLIKPRHAYFVNLTDENEELIDQCIMIYFRAPNSFTGEDVIEIHCHGAPAVIQKIFEFLRTQNMRMATPGEFSRRAFYNNKMDLSEIDGLAALLDARTDKQRAFALKSMTGFDSSVYENWRKSMIEIAAYAAAIMDYDENDLPGNISDTLKKQTQKLYDEINGALNSRAATRAIRSGFNIALVGETNVGKSSIFNRLVGSNRAIVSDIAGTTRDVVDAVMDIDGYLVNLSDTAGIRESDDVIENIGIERTHATVADADLILKVQSADCKVQIPNAKDNEIIIINKSDLSNKSEIKNPKSEIHVSALTGYGFDKLLNEIRARMHKMLDGAESDVAVNERTRALLMDAADELQAAITDHGSQITNYDIMSEHVRRAGDAIGKIMGTISVSEIADATFGQLCLGK